MAIKAIETRYAGCRFRSRLEARWAVFFDHLDIKWEYEPEGFTVGPSDDQCAYLPDFYLPDVIRDGLWVEVKGKLSDPDQQKMFHAAHPVHGLPPAGRLRLLMLGDVPRVDRGWMCWHHALRWDAELDDEIGYRPEGLFATAVMFRDDGKIEDTGDPGVSINDFATFNPSAWNFTPFVTAEPCLVEWSVGARESAAYTAARSARFEHGERG